MLHAIKCEKLQVHSAKGIIYWSEKPCAAVIKIDFSHPRQSGTSWGKKKVPQREIGQHFRRQEACFEKAEACGEDDSLTFCPPFQMIPIKWLVIKQSDGHGVSVLDNIPLLPVTLTSVHHRRHIKKKRYV